MIGLLIQNHRQTLAQIIVYRIHENLKPVINTFPCYCASRPTQKLAPTGL